MELGLLAQTAVQNAASLHFVVTAPADVVSTEVPTVPSSRIADDEASRLGFITRTTDKKPASVFLISCWSDVSGSGKARSRYFVGL